MGNTELEISKCLLNFIMEVTKSGYLTVTQLDELMTKTGYKIACDYGGEITVIGRGDKILKFNAVLDEI